MDLASLDDKGLVRLCARIQHEIGTRKARGAWTRSAPPQLPVDLWARCLEIAFASDLVPLKFLRLVAVEWPQIVIKAASAPTALARLSSIQELRCRWACGTVGVTHAPALLRIAAEPAGRGWEFPRTRSMNRQITAIESLMIVVVHGGCALARVVPTLRGMLEQCANCGASSIGERRWIDDEGVCESCMRTDAFRLDPNGPFHTGQNYHACLRHYTVIEDVRPRIRVALKSLVTLGASAYPALPQLIKMLGAYVSPYRAPFRGGHPFDPLRKDLADAIIAIGAGAPPNLLRIHADTLVAMMASHTWSVVSQSQRTWSTWSAAVHAVLAAFNHPICAPGDSLIAWESLMDGA